MIPSYRAWDKDAECMIYQKDNGDEYVWQIGTEDIWIEPIHGMTIPKQVLMQSAGLKDKNGVEIFEGDIGWDDHQEVYGQVIFENGGFKYEWENISEDLFEVTDDIELVGNIWEEV
ncbi:YopX family protein [Enterococcus mundtii]|uniref:YopX family protein n=1 Tax=Enterococcus mundtii TaxID=53346 RepID=UPI0009BF1E3E|nr:YopX family protein [Enterococcus mundtii]